MNTGEWVEIKAKNGWAYAQSPDARTGISGRMTVHSLDPFTVQSASGEVRYRVDPGDVLPLNKALNRMELRSEQIPLGQIIVQHCGCQLRRVESSKWSYPSWMMHEACCEEHKKEFGGIFRWWFGWEPGTIDMLASFDDHD